MPKEQYQPSEGETQKVKEIMWEAESEMSREREARAKFWEKVGTSGDLVQTYEGTGDRLTGVIGEKEIDITHDSSPEYEKELPMDERDHGRPEYYTGTVVANGETLTLSHGEAKKIYNKFIEGAMHEPNEKRLIRQVNKDLQRKRELGAEKERGASLEGLL